MGTEIVGLAVFRLVAVLVAMAWAWKVNNLHVSILGSTFSVIIIVQTLNYFAIGQFQLMSATQFAIMGGVPALITLVFGLFFKKKKATH